MRGIGATVGVVAALLAAVPLPAQAIMSGEESKLAPSGDPDYAAGKEAFQSQKWQIAIANLTMVVLRRPWHDNAHTMLGYSWRKLGNYDRAFEHYQTALTLNPRHRGALAYLGGAYLDLGRTADADATYRELAAVCQFVVMGFDNDGWFNGCDELDALQAEYEAHGVPLPPSN